MFVRYLFGAARRGRGNPEPERARMPSLTYRTNRPFAQYTIKEWPAHDRPRERLRTLGPRSLSPRELLALLIETGIPATDDRPGRSALDVAGDLLRWFSPGEGAQSLRRIMTAPFAALCEVPGIGPAKAAKIHAALDLGRRAVEEARPEMERLTCTRDAYERMRVAMRDLPHEEFRVLLLNVQCDLLREVVVGRGTLTACGVSPREVFKVALAENAYGMVVVHNHPSGESTPSPDDRLFTHQLDRGSEVVGVRLLDHIIIGEQRYFSFAEESLLTEGW
jgi:DNA repair protein RadC